MFCDKLNINQLTSLMIVHEVTDVVVCPGSRNGVLVHNFHTCPQIACYPVTDERSAAFFALGLSLAKRRPVAVCVTSGTALLNTLPAVAEAFYQHVPLLILSADRPPCWIDQQDGQTLPQYGALARFTKKSLQLPEPKSKDEEWWCNRLINEGLNTLTFGYSGPVHLNIPISEPLFTFHTECLPDERAIRYHQLQQHVPNEILEKISRAKMPVLVIGQMPPFDLDALRRIEAQNRILILPEQISNTPYGYRAWVMEEKGDSIEFSPDLVIHIGGMLVGKNIKKQIRSNSHCQVIRITEDEQFLTDTFCRLTDFVKACPLLFFRQLASYQSEKSGNAAIVKIKEQMDNVYRELRKPTEPEIFNSRNVVFRLTSLLNENISLHFANSSAVRYANVLPLQNCRCKVYCNRGTNGIEGSLSTAAGYAAGNPKNLSVCIIGDLSFFYDINGLWHNNLGNNLRILLLNNGGGKIFDNIAGLDQSPAKKKLIAASHLTNAENVAKTYGLDYYYAKNFKSLSFVMPQWIAKEHTRPALLEIDVLEE